MTIGEPRLKSPAAPLANSYRPSGSVPHKVTESNSWLTLARAHKVDVWWLIQYNFETRNPDEINWYLKNRVGCRKMTPDRRNFRFSAADTPGIVFVPTEQVARELKNLAYATYGITIEGEEDYRDSVELVLRRIAASDVGLVLLQSIRSTGKPILITPWAGSSCNATASSTNIVDASPLNDMVLSGGGSFEPLKDPSLIRGLLGLPLDPFIGTGTGSGAVVRFSPSMFGFGAKGPCAPFAGAPGASPSQVLFHELCHAYRFTRGKFHPRPTVGGSVRYTNMEEFFAVVLSNVLTSDPTFSTANRMLRADHSGFSPLSANFSTSKGFLAHTPNRNMMRELSATDPQLTRALSAVKSYFNPFAESI